MAIVKCKECGEMVSTQAATCPKCGAPRSRGGISPWKIIGWIVLAFMALVLYSCVRVAMNMADTTSTTGAASTAPAFSSPPPPTRPQHKAEVLSFQCEKRGNYDIGKATIRNTGATTIPSAKLFVEFTDSAGKVVAADDSYFSPTDIPPGATASADVVERSAGAASCRPSAFQDGQGNPVEITLKK